MGEGDGDGQEVLVLSGKLFTVTYVVRPGQYVVPLIQQLSGLRLNGQDTA